MELAETLGFNSARSLLAGRMLPMTSTDVSEWDAYYNVKAEKMEAMREEAEEAAKSGKAPGASPRKRDREERTHWQDIRGLFGTRVAPPKPSKTQEGRRTNDA